MTVTFTPALAPSYQGTTLSRKPRVLTANFGDGYLQRVADGLNTNLKTGNLVWDSLTLSQAQAIETFFDARAGLESFYYTFPDDSSPSVIIATQLDKTWKTDGAYGLTMAFQEVADIV